MVQTNVLSKLPQRFIESLPYSIPLMVFPFPANFVAVGVAVAVITGIQLANNDRSLSLAQRIANFTQGSGFYFTAKGVEQIARSLFASSFLKVCAQSSFGATTFGIGIATLIAAEILSQTIRH